nr:potassium/sodium hyperpolarization-activated cyclic nucleotide-gated channel 1-like [Onthophagus taurus]
MMQFHNCTLEDDKKQFQRIPKFASFREKFVRRHQLSILMSFNHPLARLYYRTYSAIRVARIEHINSAHRYIIHPFSDFRKRWELFMTILLTFLLIITPLNVAFGQITLLYSTIICDIICLFDVGMRFFTGYTVDHLKTVVLDPKMIRSHYLKSLDFYLESISSFPCLIFACVGCMIDRQNTYPTYITTLFLLKVLRLKSLLEYCGHVFEYFYIIDRWYLSHLKFSILFIVTLHWFGCFIPISNRYSLLFTTYEPTCENWVVTKMVVQEQYENDFLMYYESVYIAAKHLFCITKKDQLELKTVRHIFQYIIATIIGYFYWCFALVLFIQTLFRIDNADIRYESVMNQLNKYMRHKQIPLKMQQRLVDYYEFSLGKSYCREATVITLLSKRLQHEVVMHATTMMAKNVTFLRELPDDIMSNIIANMKLEIFLPGDQIMTAGAPATGMYFINTGTVCVFSPSGREICHLDDGSYFGEVGLITQEKTNIANVVALEITEVYRLDKKDFYEQIRGNLPELYRKMESKAERRRENTKVMEEIHRKQQLEATMRVKLH